MEESKSASRVWWALSTVVLVLALVAYSQTNAFAWDEGFHLLAAQLIKSGQRPYLDFAFAQTPLNAYWNAGWMRVLGESWRAIHAIAALLITASVALASGFLRSRFKGLAWIVVLVLAGGNIAVVEFGTLGQAYALSLFLIVAAFRLAVASVERDEVMLAALGGALSGAAAGSTLLTAPAAPVLLVWIFFCSPAGRRVSRALAFLGGAAISWLPIFALFVQSPGRVRFDIFEYHLFYRRSDWPGATQHDLELVAGWIGSPQAILLVTLAAAGIWYAARESGWDPARRRELYLCGLLALAEGLYVSTAHPTFFQYYLFTTPFLAILASVGLFGIGKRLALKRPWKLTAAVCVFFCLGTVKEIYDDRDHLTWRKMEAVAAKVNEVTAAGAPLYADEETYFLTKRTPPPGNEYLSSHKLRLPADFSAFVHIVPQPEFDAKIRSGAYDTVETCEDEDWIQERKLKEVYGQIAEVTDCYVFWGKNAKPR